MKRFEILEDAEYDRYMIFMYNENGNICGVNYHHGLGDLDCDYLVNDPKLLKIYIERMGGKMIADTRESVMRDSIAELQVKTIDYEREHVIRKVVETQILIMAEKIFEKTYVGNTSLSDSESEMIAMSQKAIELIFNKIIENKHKQI